MNQLQELLATVPPGAVADDLGLDNALAACWDGLRGSGEGGMDADRLGRMKSIRWQPPILSFVIERHGGLMVGSTRAELQHWEVNLNDRTACIGKEGHRQEKPMARPVPVKAIAAEIAGLVIDGKVDERIRRDDDGTVKVVLSKCLPSGGFQWTLQSQRKRLVEYLNEQLAEHGWVPAGRNAFRPLENKAHLKASRDVRKTPA